MNLDIRQIDGWINRQMDGWMDRQIDAWSQKGRQTERSIGRLIMQYAANVIRQ